MSLTLVSPPAVEPIALDDLKTHLRVSDNVEDGYLQQLRAVVRMRAERGTRRALITQTWDHWRDEWPEDPWLELPKAPLQSITFVKYIDTAGVTQTWDASNYSVETPAGPFARRGRLILGFAKVWPIHLGRPNTIQIRMVCGYGDEPEDVPELLSQGMLLDAGTLYDIRGAVLAGSRAAAIEIPTTTSDIYRTFRSL